MSKNKKPVTLAGIFSLIKNMYSPDKDINLGELEIKGSEGFADKILVAAKFLEKQDRQSFKVLTENITEIVEGPSTLFSPTPFGVTLCLGPRELQWESDTWFASFLACEGYRAKLYKEASKEGLWVPKEKYSRKRIFEQQYECLKRLGADFEELKSMSDFIDESTNESNRND